MKTSRKIQFAVAALLWSVGCWLSGTTHPSGNAASLFLGLGPLVLYRRAELGRPVSAGEIGMGLAALAVLALLVYFGNHSHAFKDRESYVTRPWLGVLMWVAMMGALGWMMSRELRVAPKCEGGS